MAQETALDSSDTATPSGSGPFANIPLEILHRITDNLTTPELGKFRLTCRSVEQSLDKAFIDEFFTRKKFMFTRFSLETLRDIAQSRLAPYLRKLDFGLEQFYRVDDKFSGDYEFVKSVAKFKDVWTEDKLWTLSGRRHQTLMAALSGLKNLKTIMIRENNSNTRFRDGGGHEWNSYGLITLSKETGLSTSEIYPDSGLGFETANEIFICLLQALADAKITGLKGIEFVGFNNVLIEDQSLAISPSLQPSMTPVLENLEKLHLVPKWGRYSGNRSQGELGDLHLIKFLRQTVNLRDLRINGLHRDQSGGSKETFLKWLKDSDRSKVLPKLQALSIGMGSFFKEDLIDLVKRFNETLESLQLWKIRCITKEPSPELRVSVDDHGVHTFWLNGTQILGRPGRTMGSLLQSISNQQGQPITCVWSDFFTDCQQIEGLSNLRHVKFGFLAQVNQGFTSPDDGMTRTQTSRMTFGDDPSIEYTGPDWKSFVAEKAATLKPH